MLDDSPTPSSRPELPRRFLLLGALCLLFIGSLYGYFLHRDHWPPYRQIEALAKRVFDAPKLADQPVGMFARPRPDSGGVPDRDEDEDEAKRRIESIGYVGGVELGASGNGVTVRNAARVAAGLNLYNCGNAPEAVLMDAGGQVRHSWRKSYADAFPNDTSAPHHTKDFWRRVHLYPNGDLLAIFGGRGIIKLDLHSKLLWALPNKAHHQAVIAENGEIYVLTRSVRKVPELGREGLFSEDFVTILRADGSELRRTSLLKALQDSEFLGLLDFLREVDPTFHTNSIQLLGERSPAGDGPAVRNSALVSFREINTVALVDLDAERAIWAMAGLAIRQHDPSLLDNGNLLIFDNRLAELGSRAIEINPRTQELVWEFPKPGAARIFSACCGTAQRLSNGNTLITFTQTAEAFEVTADGEVVWEYQSPARTGKNNEFLAQLMEVRRIPEQQLGDWALEPPADGKH
jgi:hypothetical protein